MVRAWHTAIRNKMTDNGKPMLSESIDCHRSLQHDSSLAAVDADITFIFLLPSLLPRLFKPAHAAVLPPHGHSTAANQTLLPACLQRQKIQNCKYSKKRFKEGARCDSGSGQMEARWVLRKGRGTGPALLPKKAWATTRS